MGLLTGALLFFLIMELPITIAFLSAIWAGSSLSQRLLFIPSPIRVIVAMAAPVITVLSYFWIYDRIEFARHQAKGEDEGFMGPFLVLIYAFPIWIVVALCAFAMAAHCFYSKK